ncbi:MAG: rhomboid family intramembrane serine protease [Myxococcales bacterium]|jgi:membrane associated rhomboid family serine protease|nr:rhomboid family intramembrane serine protease [Myxococcales bacterium]
MIPIKDDNPHFLTPYVTVTIIVLNVAAWFVLQGAGQGEPFFVSLCELGLIPSEWLGTSTPGARVPLGDGVYCILEGQAPRFTVLSSMFLHGGWLHLLGNLWFLWIFGNNVEDSMGHLRFVVFYVLSGLAAAALQIATDPSSSVPMVGASGAISGVMGAYIVLYPRVGVHLLVPIFIFITTVRVPAFMMLGYWLVLQLLGGMFTVTPGGGVAFWAHVGGFVAGMVMIPFFKNEAYLERHPYYGWGPRASARRSRRRGG